MNWEEFEKVVREAQRLEKLEEMGLTETEYQRAKETPWLIFEYETAEGKKSSLIQLRAIRIWLRRLSPTFLVLHGNPGTGKTLLATKIMVRLSEELDCYFLDCQKFHRKAYSFRNIDRYMEHLCSVSLLVVDDYSAGYTTEYQQSLFFSILDFRYRNDKKTILTCNRNPLKMVGDAREISGIDRYMILMADRLREKGMFVEFDYPSLRPPHVRKMAEEGYVPYIQEEEDRGYAV